MTSRTRFFVLHIIWFLCALVAWGSLFAIYSFARAVPVIEGKVGKKKLPLNWEAAAESHGKYYQWVLEKNHMFFSYSIPIFLIVSVIGLVVFGRKIQFDRQNDLILGPRIYQLADVVTALSLLFLILAMDTMFFPGY